MKITDIIDTNLAKKDENGIWITKLELTSEQLLSQKRWVEIYKPDIKSILKQKEAFDKSKLNDHLKYIEDGYDFNESSKYLEIGCGPSHIGSYLMKKYNSNFIGVDFNYPVLVTLKKYFESEGYKNFELVYSDIESMPIRSNSIDYIYGGGVIEHSSNTVSILRELHRILSRGGISFNTVPAFNFFWLTRFYYSIPTPQPLRSIMEAIHINTLNGRVLDKHYGYELSFTQRYLKNVHTKAGFFHTEINPFAFHPYITNPKLSWFSMLYYKLSTNKIFAPFYYARAKK